MKSFTPRCVFLTTAALLACVLLPATLLAHGTGHRILENKTAITVGFFYSDAEPMRYAEVLVFSPDNQKIEYQNGRTDLHGQFAFHPDQSGTWRITADDGMGHLEQATVDVGTSDPVATTTDEEPHKGAAALDRSAPSRLAGIAAGLSILLNIVLFALWWKGRKSR
ncbi:conserved exported hypothetical protein [uncultured Desulfatiglans sp.]|uniref:Nickel transport protein n=1 Tax=Uncultured Desulfatiglans sp. TaxID=1748965 RepID=A0A653A266_UNCDX|nr:conserved exported hypothetical protein [uncultured Desulfatiglans sp.]